MDKTVSKVKRTEKIFQILFQIIYDMVKTVSKAKSTQKYFRYCFDFELYL